MSKEEKRAIRAAFRTAVFERDRYRCRVCGCLGKDRQGDKECLKYHNSMFGFSSLQDLDAHHIVDRHDMPNGGYVVENGISLCGTCHEKAELYWIDENRRNPGYEPEHLYYLIGSSLDMAIAASEKLC